MHNAEHERELAAGGAAERPAEPAEMLELLVTRMWTRLHEPVAGDAIPTAEYEACLTDAQAVLDLLRAQVGEPREPPTETWAQIRSESFQRVSDFFAETAETKPTWTAKEASEQWAMYAASVRALSGGGPA